MKAMKMFTMLEFTWPEAKNCNKNENSSRQVLLFCENAILYK